MKLDLFFYRTRRSSAFQTPSIHASLNSPSWLAISATGPHPFPSRTRQLSLSAPMVLCGRPHGRVGRCQPPNREPASGNGGGLFLLRGRGNATTFPPSEVSRAPRWPSVVPFRVPLSPFPEWGGQVGSDRFRSGRRTRSGRTTQRHRDRCADETEAVVPLRGPACAVDQPQRHTRTNVIGNGRGPTTRAYANPSRALQIARPPTHWSRDDLLTVV